MDPVCIHMNLAGSQIPKAYYESPLHVSSRNVFFGKGKDGRKI